MKLYCEQGPPQELESSIEEHSMELERRLRELKRSRSEVREAPRTTLGRETEQIMPWVTTETSESLRLLVENEQGGALPPIQDNK